jgi:hypothetical protein
METIREVNPARLTWGTFDHAKNDYVNEGDIPASYSGDSIAMGQPVRKPFRMDGEMWITISLSNHGASAYRLRAGSANSDRGLSGGSVLWQPKMAEKRRTDEQTSTQEPFSGVQGEGGIGGDPWREDGFGVGRAV